MSAQKPMLESDRTSNNSMLPNLDPAQTYTKDPHNPKVIIGRHNKPIQILEIPKMPGVYGSDPYSTEHLPKLDVHRFRNTSTNVLSIYSYKRKVKKEKLSKYMTLISPVAEEGTYSQLQREENENTRPLVILYPWLMAEEKHVMKYVRLYTDLGIDVLRVNITPLDLLQPVPRAQVSAVELLEYLLENETWHKILLHGMSVGAYGFMEVMTKVKIQLGKPKKNSILNVII